MLLILDALAVTAVGQPRGAQQCAVTAQDTWQVLGWYQLPHKLGCQLPGNLGPAEQVISVSSLSTLRAAEH